MSREDKLSQLDSAVASGRISAEEYRTQRDELLGETGQARHADDPFPPPFRWAEPGTDTTQVVRSEQLVAPADATQVVRATPGPPPAADATQVVTGAGGKPQDPDRTQFVRLPRHSPPTTPPPHATTPPWLQAPPRRNFPIRGFQPDGHDFFANAASQSRQRMLGVLVLLVLVIAVVVGSVLYFT
jgi:hypothetical protein